MAAGEGESGSWRELWRAFRREGSKENEEESRQELRIYTWEEKDGEKDEQKWQRRKVVLPSLSLSFSLFHWVGDREKSFEEEREREARHTWGGGKLYNSQVTERERERKKLLEKEEEALSVKQAPSSL